MDEQTLLEETVPWDTLSSLGVLTSLMYDFMKNWDFKTLENLNSFLVSETENNTLCEKDIQLLKGLKEKYPEASVLKFFTNKTDLQCALCISPTQKKYAIIFRGSESLLDWIYDFMIWQTRCVYGGKQFGSVHAGFFNQIMKDNFFMQLSALVEQQIALHPDYEWHISGHSAGAAHSILTGFLLAQNFPEKHFSITSLAAPRVGNEAFASLFEATKNLSHYRICYNRDVITSVPTFGYYHTGTSLLWVNDKWELNTNKPFYLYRCWSIKDHSVDLYVKALKNRITHT